MKLSEALYNIAAKKIAGENSNPLIENGVKLVPSVRRVFSKSRPVWVYLQAYEQGFQTVRPLVAFLTLYNSERNIFETPPVEGTAALNNTVRAVPLNLEFNLAKLSPGKYDCQLTVLSGFSEFR